MLVLCIKNHKRRTFVQEVERFRTSIENTALVWEQLGLNPVAARVFAYMMYAPHYSTTFEDLTEYFNVSKSAVSNGLKYLTLTQMIGSKTKEGKRKRYFGIEMNSLFESDSALKKYKLLTATINQVLKERKIKDDLHKALLDSVMIFEMMIKEYPLFVEKWKKMKK
jgi:DNA-binding transcriptional regulator GbsR (MarR family)